MKSADKVVLNTSILYGRMIISMGISLYATRIVLTALGSIDYGIFNLVAGVIAMLSFLNNAMSISTQRFLSFHQGKKDLKMQQKIFNNSFLLHIIVGVFLVLALETAGYFLFDNFLNIPSDRIASAKLIYQFMSFTVFFTVVSVPFNGLLMAHENILFVAIVNVGETVVKLAIAFSLLTLKGDKLIIYGLLTTCITIISFACYAIYCFRSYKECNLRSSFKNLSRPLITELASFAGWNLFGSLCSLGRIQGLAILLNLFVGAVVNAAYAIANQVSSQVNFLSSTLLRALNPQIMKSEGAGDRERMLRLSMMASKFGFFLLALVAIPCIFEMDSLLHFWLGKAPKYTSIFCKLILIGLLCNQLTIGIQSALQASGKIGLYQAIVGTTILLNLPVAYLLLHLDYEVYSVLISYVIMEAIACVLRLFFAKQILKLSIKLYFDRVLKKEILPILITLICDMLVIEYCSLKYRFVLTFLLSSITLIICIYHFGFCKDEKELVNSLVSKLRNNFNSFVSKRKRIVFL